MTKSQYEELTFEQAIGKLEEIVDKLEEGDVPLEKAIDYFQDGMEISKICNDKLTKVQDKMATILAEDNELKTFEIEED